MANINDANGFTLHSQWIWIITKRTTLTWKLLQHALCHIIRNRNTSTHIFEFRIPNKSANIIVYFDDIATIERNHTDFMNRIHIPTFLFYFIL